jgi:hypothetical protein
MKIKNDYRADGHARTSETTLLSLELRRLTTFAEPGFVRPLSNLLSPAENLTGEN